MLSQTFVIWYKERKTIFELKNEGNLIIIIIFAKTNLYAPRK